MMVKVLRAGGLKEEHLAAIVDILVPFYQQAEGGKQVRNNGTSKAVGKNVLDNFSETEQFVGTPPLSSQQFEEIRAYATNFLAQENIFNARIEGGYIRDCHGDLHSGNICLEPRPAIFDCIEFNENLRFTDVAADVAFLAMDLDFHQLQGLSTFFIDRFIAQSGDQRIHQILNFYKCYRAYVRGKIGLLTSVDPNLPPAAAQECANQAGLYFQLAHRYIK